ncbi:putative BPI/LBP family protein At1g04970 isoform X1 [Bidens hawaiensis]|uniref:putative BPI/LBP family protein At1g04970 isoform X1 n=1 Tax=Bidens hawaiensis TaxID=980011 RepID=UPI0040491444
MSPKIILITKYPILILLILLSLLITPHPTLADQSSISVLITQPGLDFIKNLLVTKAISKITPTPLQEIDRAVNIPVIGKVHIVLSDINIYRFNVGLSQVIPNEGGITIGGSDVRCDLRVKWHYYYGAALFPISVSDTGTADIQVNGMEMGVALGLDIKDGSMQLSTVECSCHINDVTIDLDGGASWLYQGILDAFKEEIESTVAKTITNILKTEISKLGYVLQNLPKQIPVDGVAALNVTLVNSPFLSDSSLGFEINGLFIENKSDKRLYGNSLQPPVRCSDPSKMIGIALDEAVFKSALALYYNAMFMHWIVDKLPEQSLLNTAGWRFIIPQLYRKYPNDDMNLNISLSDPPAVQISQQKIDSTVYADLIIDVLQGVDTIPVACISLVISGTGSVQITGNNLAAHLEMSDLSMSLKWSKIGTLHMFLIQPVVWTMIETVFLPYVNARIGVGFPLPLIHGFMLRNAEIITSDSRVTVCGDVTYQESFTGTRIYTS